MDLEIVPNVGIGLRSFGVTPDQTHEPDGTTICQQRNGSAPARQKSVSGAKSQREKQIGRAPSYRFG
jgi:hypothetical protein